MNEISREYIDDLTGLYNRRFLNKSAVESINEADQKKSSLSITIIDLDHFKNVNDTYGHSRGDLVLTEFAGFLKDLLRKGDTVYRYGGDEFVCILPDTGYEQARRISLRFIEQCRNMEFVKIRLTLSIGIASYPSDGEDWFSVFDVADHRLYSAKRYGRDRIGIPDTDKKTLIIPTKEIIGRDSELSMIKQFVEPAINGRGGAVTLSGEIGVGKTRLVHELINTEHYGSFEILSSNLSATTQSIPYYPFREILRTLSHEKGREYIQKIPEVYRIELAKMVPELSDEVSPDSKQLFMIDKFRLFEAVSKYLQLQLEDNPLFICFDNIQWADDSSLELIYYLLKTQREFPVVYFLIYRVEEIKKSQFQKILLSMTREDLHRSIMLEPLEAQYVTLMISTIVNSNPSPELSDYIFSKTGGNPYFIEEMLKSLIKCDSLTWDGSEWLFDKTKSTVIPYSIESVVNQKLGLLSNKARNLFEYVSVIGRNFDFNLLKNITDMNEGYLFDLLDEMLETRLLVETGKEHYRFPEDIIRKSVYAKIGKARLINYHRTVGEELLKLHIDLTESVVEELSLHFYLSGEMEKAVKYSLIAAHRARDAYANEDAIKFYNIVIECLPETEIEEKETKYIECLRNRAGIYRLIGKKDNSIKDLESAINKSGNIGNRKSEADCLIELSEIYIDKGEYDGARKYIENALKTYGDLNDNDGEAICSIRFGNICWFSGEYTKALEFYQKSLISMEKAGNRKGIASSLNNIGIVYFSLGNYSDALKFALEAQKIRQEISDRKNEAISLNNIGAVYMNIGEYSRALEYYNRSLAISEEIGDLQKISLNFNNIGGVYLMLDEWQKALELFRNSLKIRRAIGEQKDSVSCLNNIGNIYGSIGLYSRALEYYRDAISIADETGNRMDKASCLNNAAGVYIELGDYSKAEELLRDSLRIQREIGDRSGEISSLITKGYLFIEKGDLSDAEDCNNKACLLTKDTESDTHAASVLINRIELHLKQNVLKDMAEDIEGLISLSEKLGSREKRGKALTLSGRFLARKKNWEKSETAFSEAISIYSELEYKPNLAESYFYHGLMLEASGDTKGSKNQYEKAGKNFRELGTKEWIKKADAKLKNAE